MNDIWRLSAVEVASLVRQKKISAREAMVSALDRLERVNPLINAVVDYKTDYSLAQADAVDAAIARGEPVGPLAGVPVTIKVLTDQAGFATTNGLRIQRDLVAQTDSPMVDNFLKAGATIVGRTNTPAFSYRWFTDNQLHGLTKNPRNNAITPGGSSGGASAATVAGIGHIGHGTDIAGSVRYPAYAVGIHGLRLTLGRAPNFNASGPERSIGSQIMAVSGPLARTIADLRIAFAAMAAPHAPDARDPWYVPVPLEGAPAKKVAALCIAPDGLEVASEVKAALVDAAKRLERAGWTVEEIVKTPPLKEAAQLQVNLWIGDNYEAQLAAAEREGDAGALACLRGHAGVGRALNLAGFSSTLIRRATLTREWQLFFDRFPVLLMPVSGELPFEDQLDLRDAESWARVWRAQMPVIGTPFMGLPGLTVATGLVGQTPVGVQVVAGRYREDLCLLAGEAIEAGGVPPSPIDPVGLA
ncbi:amidase family protein [Bradyrhizobium sp. LHD-71]|uniref:amidase family protein n=1 Tax=Bradyrhizobium sp. LHD-71 TaxID=3072141 RepID=UPI00280EF06D|nr:amidase family protein [Bradyrhizobium sp. LHD-71]MDQ8731396.1 amidase family protein [Bradyrhizobium sp. LHD-71]